MSINSRMAVARAGIATKAFEGQLRKTFDPNQLRNRDGEWASEASSPNRKTVVEHVRNAKGWLTTTRVSAAANKVAPHAKEILAAVAASIITTHNNSDLDYEVVKQGILNLSDGMKISQEQARDHLVSVMNHLKKARSDILGKAKEPVDPVQKHLDDVIDALKKVKLGPPKKSKTKD